MPIAYLLICLPCPYVHVICFVLSGDAVRMSRKPWSCFCVSVNTWKTSKCPLVLVKHWCVCEGSLSLKKHKTLTAHLPTRTCVHMHVLACTFYYADNNCVIENWYEFWYSSIQMTKNIHILLYALHHICTYSLYWLTSLL